MLNLEDIALFAQTTHAKNTDGHGFDHIRRVVGLARRILATEPKADKELVLTTCYLHDTYDDKLVQDVGNQKSRVYNFLKDLNYPKTIQVFDIIDRMSFSSGLIEKQNLDLNGQIVQDADRLDSMGATMIVRTLEYGWAHDRTLYDPNIPPQVYKNKEEYHKGTKSTTLNHFYEKAFLLKDLLNTPEAKRLGQARDKIMHDFVLAFETEYKETEFEN